ncbi:MAG: DUF499 domain-containing protein [Planctomycetota bacterium]
MAISTACKPRKEVLKGDLDDAIFAADFGDLIAVPSKAPPVYRDPAAFFQNTHPARHLRKVIESVFGRLAQTKEGGASIRLSTGFGGGKTHTLMALWHLAQHIADPGMGSELLPGAGRPEQVTCVAVDASKAGVPTFARHGKREIRSLWGEIAWQLAGEKGWRSLGDADDSERQPDESLIQRLFPAGPVLFLLDELVVYMATLSERGQGNLLAFLNKLSAVVNKRPQTVLVVTDPAGQLAYAKESAKLGDGLTSAAIKLDDTFGRKMTDFDPIGDESARVIVRRLFERVDPAAAQAASAAYHLLYERVARELPGSISPQASTSGYAQRIVECYPFHPRLLDTAQGRLGALQEFHKSRGTLRLFARILRTVFESGVDIELVTAGEIDWSSDRIQADLLQRLNRDNFKSAVSADIAMHARELDGGAKCGIHVRVASALLLESIPMQSNSGLDPADLTLAVLRPEEAGPEPSEALDRLVGVSWHTYPMPGGRGWQFRYEPNIVKQIEEGMGQVPREDARARVLAEAQGYFSGPTFTLVPWPHSARQVPESAELQLALCEEERTARAVCAFADDNDPRAPIPRAFQNAIVAVTATASSCENAIDRAQRLLAAEAIDREHRSGDSNKLIREQLKRILPELLRRFRIQTCRAFDRVVLSGGSSYPLEEEFQVPEEQMLQRAHGQACLKKFLDKKGLLYQPGDMLDTPRFLRDVLPGATPLSDKPGVYTTRAIHTRFLSAPGLRLLPDAAIVRQTVMKAVADGKGVVRLSDGRAYDAAGCVEGAEGKRRRMPGALTSLPLDDSTYVTRADSEFGLAWVREDAPGYQEDRETKKTDLPPPVATQVEAGSWEELLALAEERPLMRLELGVRMAAAAKTLAALAQPLGAENLTLNVSVSGTPKDGGWLSFQATDVKPTHPTKPLAIGETLFNSLAEGGSYEAGLTLTFGEKGRTGLAPALQKLAEAASEDVRPVGTFDKPHQASR